MKTVTYETIWMDRTAVAVAAIICFMVLISFLHQIWNHKSNATTQRRWRAKLMIATAIVCMILNVLYNTIRIPVSFGIHSIQCTIQTAALTTIWTMEKLSLYMFLIARLDVTFNDSMFKMTRLTFKMLYFIIGLGFVTQQIMIVIWAEGAFVEIDGILFCVPVTNAIVWYLFAFWDCLISMIGVSLFVVKLLKTANMRRSTTSRERLPIWDGISKYITLSVIGIVSTMICFIGISQTSWIVFVAADTTINSLCIYLMFTYNSSKYQCICGLANRCIGKECLKLCVNLSGESRQKPMKMYSISTPRSTGDNATISGPSSRPHSTPDLEIQAAIQESTATATASSFP